MENNNIFMWSDGWYIENDKAWFVSAEQNILFGLNMKKGECEYAMNIPVLNSQKFRLNPRCLKYGSNIFCIPDKGRSIWIYNIDNDNFLEISINISDEVRLWIYFSMIYDSKIYAVSFGIGKIIEIDAEKKKITNYYELCKEGLIPDSIRNGTEIYSLSESGNVYCFDIKTKRVMSYMLPDIGRKFYGLGFDGKNFWLGGFRKEIYVWDKDRDTIKVIDNFPKDFGVYNFGIDSDGRPDCFTEEYDEPTFLYLVTIGEFIWFIPYLTNKVVYVNKYSYELDVLEIKEEEETQDSILNNELKQKYVLEYVTDERYIGLFSAKNRCILEIDTKLLKYRWYYLKFSDKCLQDCAVISKNIFREKSAFDRDVFKSVFLSKHHLLSNMNGNNVGNKIYHELIQ